MRLSEQLESRSAIGKPEQALRKELIEDLVRAFIKQAETLFLVFFSKTNPKPSAFIKKVLFLKESLYTVDNYITHLK
jgi:hypothetical protein